jgi:hypothetical protein
MGPSNLVMPDAIGFAHGVCSHLAGRLCDKMQCVVLVHARTQQHAPLVTCGNASKGSGSCCSAGSSQLGRAGKLLMITVVVF